MSGRHDGESEWRDGALINLGCDFCKETMMPKESAREDFAEKTCQLEIKTDEINDCSFTSDGKHALTCAQGSPVQLWDVETGRCRNLTPTRHSILKEQAMVMSKSELIASLQNEVRILLHLAGKIDRAKLDYRPTPKQRSTQVISFASGKTWTHKTQRQAFAPGENWEECGLKSRGPIHQIVFEWR